MGASLLEALDCFADDTRGGQIYSSSYDCTVRRTNFETGASEEVVDGDAFGEENLLHSFDFTSSGHEIWGATTFSSALPTTC